MDKLIKWMWVLITIMWTSLIVSVIVEPYSITAYWVFLGLNWACILSGVIIAIVAYVRLKRKEKKLKDDLIKIEFDIKNLYAEFIEVKEMEYNNLEILDALWYGKLGIIKARDKVTNEIKIYIGEGDGLDIQTDIYHIVSFGTKYTPESFKKLIDWLGGNNTN